MVRFAGIKAPPATVVRVRRCYAPPAERKKQAAGGVGSKAAIRGECRRQVVMVAW